MINVGKSVKVKSKMITKVSYYILFLLFIIIFIVLIIESNIQKGSIYLIPEGYKGKLSIVYNQKDKPALEEKNGYQVVKFPLSGIVKTSSHPRIGKQHDKYFYYTKDGKITPAKDIQLGGGKSTEASDSFLYEFWVEGQ